MYTPSTITRALSAAYSIPEMLASYGTVVSPTTGTLLFALLYYSSTTPLLPLYYSSTTPLLLLYYYSTTTLLLLYYSSTTPLLPLYYSSTTPLLLLYYLKLLMAMVQLAVGLEIEFSE